ncbi:MAG: MMPL family transporter [Treponema sp.]|jgi:predicted RND superfamily exporter protein|nr:MMPL family transporter [Treponema sp.]
MEKFFKRPWVVVGAIAVITAFFALQLPRVELDNDATGFIPEDNEAYLISEHLEEVYGEDEGVVMFVGLERKQGTVFDQAFLSRLREFTDAVEDISIVEEAASILTMPYITGKDDSIIVADLVDDDFTGTPAEIAELKRRLSSWDLYKGQLVSDNFSATQVIINLNIATEDLMRDDVNADVANIRKTANTMFDGLATVYLAGQPVMTDTTNNAMMTDLTVLIPLVLVVILAVLLFSFRRWTFVALPLLTVVVAVIWAMGAMPLLGFKMSFMMVILPIILIAVGSAYSIHVVSHYLDAVKGQTLSRDEHREFVFSVLRKVLKPVLLAALTTMAGFVSFCFTYLVPMRSFGYFSCFGVAVALLAAITLIPALLLIRGPEKERVVKKAKEKKLSRLDTALGDIFTAIAGKKAAVLAITAVVLAVSIYGLSKVVVDSSMVEFFSDDSDISRSDRFIREYFGGSTQLTLSVEADTTEALLNPRTLTALDDLAVYLTERVPHVGKVAGFTDMIKRMNQLFNR